jgi:hypothetical protein
LYSRHQNDGIFSLSWTRSVEKSDSTNLREAFRNFVAAIRVTVATPNAPTTCATDHAIVTHLSSDFTPKWISPQAGQNRSDEIELYSKAPRLLRGLMTMTDANTTTLVLTVQERLALSVALKTTLRFWGNSEDRAQERIRGKLQSIVGKLDAVTLETNSRVHGAQ